MRIGILQTDTVRAELVPRHGDYPEMFRALLGNPAARPGRCRAPDFVDIDVQAGAFPQAADCDAYVITGSRHSVYDDLPWIASLAGFVDIALAARRKVVGICFGHQLVAHFFGGEARPAEGGWCVGVQHAEVIERATWMDPPSARLRLLASHRDQVVRLPPGARRFAVGKSCPESGFVLGDVLTLQGHPEFSTDYAAALLDSREELLGAAVYAAGKASLAEGTDSVLAARWMLNFMCGHGENA